jgi:hypothetical protein
MVTDSRLSSIVTRVKFGACRERMWEGLVFFEQIAQPPPLFLRLLLPRPIGAEGRKSHVGDESVCRYETGHLLKRVTHVERGRHYGFEITDQQLAIGRGIRLSGGCYSLSELPDGSTEIALKTRYTSVRRPRWLWKTIEAAVCHRFHRHILGAIRRSLEPKSGAAR